MHVCGKQWGHHASLLRTGWRKPSEEYVCAFCILKASLHQKNPSEKGLAEKLKSLVSPPLWLNVLKSIKYMKLNFCCFPIISFWLAQVMPSLTWWLQCIVRVFICRWRREPGELNPAEHYTRQWLVWEVGTAMVSLAIIFLDLTFHTQLFCLWI